jgi:PAS domain S-box-containing protein
MPRTIDVPGDIVRKWQEIVDLLAEVTHVPAALIMRVEPPNIKVFVSSESHGNPYERDELAPLDTGLYCETVMATRQPLLVPDSLADEDWKTNPDVKLGMISYLGLPICWPDGEIFGTICILDSQRNDYSELYLRLLSQWRDVLQTDLESVAAVHGALEERDAQIRRLIDANIIGIVIWTRDGRVHEANDAYLRMIGYDREDLALGRLSWMAITPPEWRERTELALVELDRSGAFQPFEKEYLRKDGSRVPVLVGGATFGDGHQKGVAFMLDLTERKRAEAEARESDRRYREVLTDLAHAGRVATLGQLTAAIAHEMHQPITATVINAQLALRWLDAPSPNLGEVRQALSRIVRDGNRAGEIIGRIRELITKTPPRGEPLDINAAIREVMELTRGEAVKHRVTVEARLAADLPPVRGDRVQIQQVMLNLIVNAVEALSATGDGARHVVLGTTVDEAGDVQVAVADSGPGLSSESLEHLFQVFHTTKPGGFGIGLSICRSIIEAHGGRLWATPNEPGGAVFLFTLPSGAGAAA